PNTAATHAAMTISGSRETTFVNSGVPWRVSGFEGVLFLIIRKTLHAEIVIRTQTESNPDCPGFISKKYKPEWRGQVESPWAPQKRLLKSWQQKNADSGRMQVSVYGAPPPAQVCLATAGTVPALFHFSFVTVTASENWRLELGSSTMPTTVGLPIVATVLALMWSCRRSGIVARFSCSGLAKLLMSARTSS